MAVMSNATAAPTHAPAAISDTTSAPWTAAMRTRLSTLSVIDTPNNTEAKAPKMNFRFRTHSYIAYCGASGVLENDRGCGREPRQVILFAPAQVRSEVLRTSIWL